MIGYDCSKVLVSLFYLSSLGEFASLYILVENPQSNIAIKFYLVAKFFTHLTIFNILIAIIGESFAYATENKEKFSTKMKLCHSRKANT